MYLNRNFISFSCCLVGMNSNKTLLDFRLRYTMYERHLHYNGMVGTVHNQPHRLVHNTPIFFHRPCSASTTPPMRLLNGHMEYFNWNSYKIEWPSSWLFSWIFFTYIYFCLRFFFSSKTQTNKPVILPAT
jgi:hypothetical protein